MRIPNKLYKIKILDNYVDKSFYYIEQKKKRKGQFLKWEERNPTAGMEKYERDDFIGKIAEFAVFGWLSSFYGNIVSPPDIKVYDVYQKSWDSDLKIFNSDLKIAVKGQSKETVTQYNYPKSWTFQNEDIEAYSGSGNIFLCPVQIDIDNKIAYIIASMKNNTAIPAMLRSMKKESLRNNKKALYFDDIEKMNKDERWELLPLLDTLVQKIS